MNKKWWKAAGIRAVKTVAQTAVATIGTSAVMSSVNWTMVASASVLAGVLSLLTSTFKRLRRRAGLVDNPFEDIVSILGDALKRAA